MNVRTPDTNSGSPLAGFGRIIGRTRYVVLLAVVAVLLLSVSLFLLGTISAAVNIWKAWAGLVRRGDTGGTELVHEFNDRALILDTETIGSGPLTEVIEVALGDTSGNILYESLVRPVFNPLPPQSKHKRFDRTEFAAAPEWPDVRPRLRALIDNKLLIAYNGAFDRRALAATCSRYRQVSAERGWRCAMQLVKMVIGMKKSLTLGEACAHFGVEAGNHRAARDVLATYGLLRKLIPPAE